MEQKVSKQSEIIDNNNNQSLRKQKKSKFNTNLFRLEKFDLQRPFGLK